MSIDRNDIWKLAEAYLNGKLTAAELQELDNRRMNDAKYAAEFNDCVSLLSGIKNSTAHKRVRNILQEVHKEVVTPKEDKLSRKTVSILKNHWRTASIAACIAVLASLTTFWMVQHSNQKIASQYSLLRKDLEKYKRSQNKIIKDIKEQTSRPGVARYSATGFALSNDGYLVTNYHVIDGADSVYIQHKNGNYHKVHVVSFNEPLDVVVLKVETDDFRFSKYDIPYAVASDKKLLGTHVFTLGFPQDEIVYNEGYISSKNGYNGDSAQYRLDIPAGPGQSGAPVIDGRGNIIGIITGKETESEGTTYAVSSAAIVSLLESLPEENKIKTPHSNKLGKLSREKQIEQLEHYTCSIKVFKQ